MDATTRLLRAELEAGEPLHRGVRLLHEVADDDLGVAHPDLVRERDVLVERLHLPLDDLLDHRLRLALGPNLLDEDRPLVTDPALPPYDRSKALGEIEIQRGIQRGLDAIIILPSGILGPYDFRPSLLGESLQLMQRGGVPVLTTGGYNWVDARDVAAGAICAAEAAKAGSRYILSGHWHSIYDVATTAAKISGTRAPRLVIPLRMAELALPIMEQLATIRGSQPVYTRAMLSALKSNRHISYALASHDLGYSPRPFLETLTDTLTWFSQQKDRQ